MNKDDPENQNVRRGLTMAVAVAVAPLVMIAAWSAWLAFGSGFMGVPDQPDPEKGVPLVAVLLGLIALPFVVGGLMWRRLTSTRDHN